MQKYVTIVNLRRPSRSSILTSSLFAAGVPTVNFYSAFVGAMSLCEIPNLCQFPWYLMVNSYAPSFQFLLSWYLVVDWYSYWRYFLDNMLLHGWLQICKALSSADLVFLTSCRNYGYSCLHILLYSPLHHSCGVFIPVNIRIIVGSLYPLHYWAINFLV